MKVEKQDSSLWGPLWMSTVSLQINFFPFSPPPAVSGRLAPDYSNRLLRCLSRVQPAGGSSGSSEVGVLNPPIYPPVWPEFRRWWCSSTYSHSSCQPGTILSLVPISPRVVPASCCHWLQGVSSFLVSSLNPVFSFINSPFIKISSVSP